MDRPYKPTIGFGLPESAIPSVKKFILSANDFYMNVRGKVVVVTGAGSGMGRELTIQLVQKGAKVAMADINEKGLEETAELAGKTEVSMHTLNIADRESVRNFL